MRVLIIFSITLLALMQNADFVNIISRLSSIFDLNDNSNAFRINESKYLYEIAASDMVGLIGGQGVGNFGPTSQYFNLSNVVLMHNYYAHLVLEFGLIGLLLYLFIFGYIFILSISKLFKKLDKKVLIYLIITSSLFVAGFVGETPITFPLNMLQWITIGLLLKNCSLRNSTKYENS